MDTDFHLSRISYSRGNPQLWHLDKVKGSYPELSPRHSPSQNPVIYSYHTPFSLLARHPSLSLSLSLKQSFMVSIYLFRGRSTKSLPAQPLIYTLLAIIFSISPHDRTTVEHLHQSFCPPSSSLHTTHFSVYSFGTLSILLIPSKLLRLSIYTTLFIDHSFSFHIFSLPYMRIGTSIVYYKTLAH